MGRKRLRIVVIVRCPLCGGWIVGNAYSAHLEDVHLQAPQEGLSAAGCGPGDESPPDRIVGPEERLLGVREVCNRCLGTAAQLSPSEAGELLNELGRRFQQGQDASLGFLMYD